MTFLQMGFFKGSLHNCTIDIFCNIVLETRDFPEMKAGLHLFFPLFSHFICTYNDSVLNVVKSIS